MLASHSSWNDQENLKVEAPRDLARLHKANREQRLWLVGCLFASCLLASLLDWLLFGFCLARLGWVPQRFVGSMASSSWHQLFDLAI